MEARSSTAASATASSVTSTCSRTMRGHIPARSLSNVQSATNDSQGTII
ncbi:unnamed protein product [Larinioides sclopetarius]